MKEPKKITPPKWAERLLSWYCRPQLLEDLQGDLNEYFQRNLKEKGPRRAKLIYILDVFKFFRSYTVRKPEFLNLFIQWIMIGSYIKTSGRNIVRNKLFSTINIIGLAVSMSVGLVLIAAVSDLLSYDRFHEKRDRVYRVISSNQNLQDNPHGFASTSVIAGRKIRETLAGIEDLTMLRREFRGDAHVGDNIVPLVALWADPSFFNVFTFPLVSGDVATALRDPYSLLLTETSAKKIFGDVDALGKEVKFDTISYVVTAVMKDVPVFSHLQFEALVSFSTVELQKKDDRNFLSWGSIWSNYVYLLLPESHDLQTLQANLDKMSVEGNTTLKGQQVTLSLQPLNRIVLGKDLSNLVGPAVPAIILWVIGGLAFVVILSACFNYTNLSIARSLSRAREVGIRKVIGARKGHVLGQFIVEAVIISILALLLSFLLFLFLRPQFLGFAPELQKILTLELTPVVIGYFLLLAIAVGITAGFLPALFFSRINALQVLKGASSMKVFKHVSLRKALIVVQYTISLIFIGTTLIGFNQYKNFISFDLGFTTENILNIKLQGNKADLLVKELNELPEVNGLARSLMVTSIGSYYSTWMKYKDPHDSTSVWFNAIDENYFPLHGHKLLTGRNFTPRTSDAVESEVIVNEEVLRRFDIAKRDPVKALGETMIIEGKPLVIIGVLKNFHYGKVDNPFDPVIFRALSEKQDGYVNVRILSKDLPATMASIEKAWKKMDKVHTFTAAFYNEQIERAYSEFSAMIKITGFLAFLAICISSMGLFGMVVFTTETKLREISIRKVLGASEQSLIYLLSRGFLTLLCLSALVALPVTYLFFEEVVLPTFAFHAPVGFSELLSSVALVMAIALILIGSQTLKVARSNPADVLKAE